MIFIVPLSVTLALGLSFIAEVGTLIHKFQSSSIYTKLKYQFIWTEAKEQNIKKKNCCIFSMIISHFVMIINHLSLAGNITVILRRFVIFKLQRKLKKNIRACTKCDNLSSGYTFHSSEDPIAKLETVIRFNNRYFQLFDCHAQLPLALMARNNGCYGK